MKKLSAALLALLLILTGCRNRKRLPQKKR